jgi:Ca-activated chloride channel family protein
MSLARTLLFFIAMALIATLALLLDGVALFAQSARGNEPQTVQQPAQQPAPPQQPATGASGAGARSGDQRGGDAQQPQQPAPDAFRFKSSVELINVSATVVDQVERFVPNLHKEDFVLYEDDKLQAITHFSDERVPVSLGILLDTSGSMEGEKFRHATDAIERFMRELLDPDDEVFLFTFNDQPRMLQGWTKDRDLVMRQLRRTYPVGGTAMYDTVAEAIPYAQRGHNRKKAIVIISDGNDNKSTTVVSELRSLIRETEVLLYAIGIDGSEATHTNYNTGGGRGRPLPGRPGTGRWPQQSPSTQFQTVQPLQPLPLAPYLELAQIQWPMPGGGRRPTPPPGPGFPPQWPQPQPQPQPPGTPPRTPQRPVIANDGVNSHALRELTDDSGGRTEIVRDIADLEPSTASIANELSRQYSLAYEPVAAKDGRWHTIRLEAKNRDYKVRARKGYMATP